MKKIILCAALGSLLVACSSTPLNPADQVASTSSSAAANGSGSSAVTAPVTSANPSASTLNDPLKDPNNILAKRTVYFEYDQYTVDEKYKSLVQAHANYLRNHPNAKVTLEGNTDERGGAEYNLSLGQLRAEEVRKLMRLMGASDSQLEAVSFGKEKPAVVGSSESEWEKNRRTDLRYQGE